MTDKPKLVALDNVRKLDTYLEQCKQSSVETLTEILELAKQGQIKQVAIAFTMVNGKGGDSMSMMEDRISMYATLRLAADAMSQRIRDDDTPIKDLIDPDDGEPA